MAVARCLHKGSDYIGAYAVAAEGMALVGRSSERRLADTVARILGVKVYEVAISGSDLVGMLCRANSNGIVVSNLAEDHEIDTIKRETGLNVLRLKSVLNAVGNNILANDKVAIVNPEYDQKSREEIADVLGVEVFAEEIGGFKTVGANNILTNRGAAINNRADDAQKAAFDGRTGFDSVSTTANTGSLNIGLAVVANSKGAVAGGSTTGFELSRIMEALDMNE